MLSKWQYKEESCQHLISLCRFNCLIYANMHSFGMHLANSTNGGRGYKLSVHEDLRSLKTE